MSLSELHWDDERIEHIAGHEVTIGEVLEVLEFEFEDWKDEADLWERQEFVVWSEAAVETATREAVTS